MLNTSVHILIKLPHHTNIIVAWRCSGQGVGLAIDRSWVRFPAAALSGNDPGQVVHTSVPLFTKQYNLVPCEGFHVNAPYVAAIHGSNEQWEYCSSGSAAILIAKNRDINYLLYFNNKPTDCSPATPFLLPTTTNAENVTLRPSVPVMFMTVLNYK